MAHTPVNMPVMPTDGKVDVADKECLVQLGSRLRKASSNGHLLGLWQTLTLLNQHNDEMDAHVKSIDATDENGETALTLAAMHGHARVVQVCALCTCLIHTARLGTYTCFEWVLFCRR